MRAIYACMGRLWIAGATLIMAMAAAMMPAAAGDGPIADLKIWCGDAAKMIADKDTDKFFDSFVFASGHLVDRPTVAQAFSSLAPGLARQGDAVSESFLLQKDYGDSFSRVWFLVQYEKGNLFLRCEGAKRGEGWIVNSFIYNSEASKVDLP